MPKIITYTAEEARNWKPDSEEEKIIQEWENQEDHEIDYSEIPKLDDEFFRNATLINQPENKIAKGRGLLQGAKLNPAFEGLEEEERKRLRKKMKYEAK